MKGENMPPEVMESLVKRAQVGDEAAFCALYDELYDRVYRYTAFRVNAEDVEDLVSDVFVKALENLHRYEVRPGAKFSSWVFRIAHNRIIDFYRREKDILGLEEHEELMWEIPDTNTPDPQMHLLRREEAQTIRRVLKKLPDIQREVLELKFLEEFSNADIAHIIGKSEGNVRVIQLRALREMKKLWADEMDAPDNLPDKNSGQNPLGAEGS